MMPASKVPERLTSAQRDALVSLLSDEDPNVYRVVRAKLLSFGHEAMDWLKPHRLSDNLVLRRRANAIIDTLLRQDGDNAFLAFCLHRGDDLDLEEGAWLLASTRYPEINVAAYSALLDEYADTLRPRIAEFTQGHEIVGAIVKHLFSELQFTGNEVGYLAPENSYLNQVLDHRLGDAISLSIVFLCVAKRLKLPVVGIGLPDHVICRYQTATEELFIDPFNRGRMLSKMECVKFLHHVPLIDQAKCMTPASPRKLLIRLCSKLHQSYQVLRSPEETERVQRYMVALVR